MDDLWCAAESDDDAVHVGGEARRGGDGVRG
eukprot:CAMPEP_0194289918 /NCGR_PEP_ID=MMETSP0169-20130528/40176_1 /TAXON_ID=218684 /ORGANISM="Corethron pennatum, Strain L29A3" /LENGTH=30 /DNA_ID= /DNA_START= /DNA_END= /DNA_ORIENTATION=